VVIRHANSVENQIMDLEDDHLSADIEMEMINQEVNKETSMVCYMRNPRIMMPLVSCILGTVFLLFSEPIISDHLIELGLSEDYIGFIFAGSCLSYAISAPIVGYLTNIFSKESLTLFAYILSAIALCIQGPSKVLGIEQNLHMTVSGFIFLGGMEAFIFVPLMPILIESLLNDFKERNTAFKKLSEKDNEQIEELMSDKASSIF
jgi:hypothetical protein